MFAVARVVTAKKLRNSNYILLHVTDQKLPDTRQCYLHDLTKNSYFFHTSEIFSIKNSHS